MFGVANRAGLQRHSQRVSLRLASLLRARCPARRALGSQVRAKSVLPHSLPEPEPAGRRWLRYGVYTAIGTALWTVSLAAVFNQQRLASSVMSGALFAAQNDPAVIAVLGRGIKLQKQYPWLPQPYVYGTINQIHGKVDISFYVTGQQGTGTVYFRSTRDSRTLLWTTERFELELSDGRCIQLPSSSALAEAIEGLPATA